MAAKNKFMNAMKMPAIADMFSSEADRQRESGDLVTEVPLSELHPFVNHPFEVRDDEDMSGTMAVISSNMQRITFEPAAMLPLNTPSRETIWISSKSIKLQRAAANIALWIMPIPKAASMQPITAASI